MLYRVEDVVTNTMDIYKMNSIIADLMLIFIYYLVRRFFAKRALENVNKEYRSKSDFELLNIFWMRKRYFNKVGWKYAKISTYWLTLLLLIAFNVIN